MKKCAIYIALAITAATVLGQTPQGLNLTRDDFTRAVFGAGGLPLGAMPDAVTPASPSPLAGRPATDLQITTTASLHAWFWDAGSDVLCLVHQGHATYDTIGVGDLTREVLDAGDCDVLGFEMQGFGMNGGAHPPDLFEHLFQVVAALNWALAQKPYVSVAMTGISGGGWATTLYAALDDRIAISVAVAGSLPIHYDDVTWTGPRDGEQLLPPAIGVPYEQLYLWGATAGRSTHLVLDSLDPCCFPAPVDFPLLVAAWDAVAAGTIQLTRYADGIHEYDAKRRGLFRSVLSGGVAPPPPPPPPPVTVPPVAGSWRTDGFGGRIHLNGEPTNPEGPFSFLIAIKPEGDAPGTERVMSQNSHLLYKFLQLTSENKLVGGCAWAPTGGSSVNVVFGQTVIPIGVWSHVALAWDGLTMELYVDGALDGSASFGTPCTPVLSGARWLLGAGIDSYVYQGLVTEVLYYGRALTPAEVADPPADFLWYFPGEPDASVVGAPLTPQLIGGIIWDTETP